MQNETLVLAGNVYRGQVLGAWMKVEPLAVAVVGELAEVDKGQRVSFRLPHVTPSLRVGSRRPYQASGEHLLGPGIRSGPVVGPPRKLQRPSWRL